MLKCDLLVDSKDLRATLLKLKKDDDFTILLDMTAVDYSKFPDSTPSRFAVVYVLRSSDFKKETTVKAFVSDETLSVDTVSDIFPSANWAEREAYDQYGVIFLNHPNLKRVLNHKQ